MEAIRPCKCGAKHDDVTVNGKRGWKWMYYWVSCGKCGKESLKHASADAAVADWNWMQTHDEETGDYTGE